MKTTHEKIAITDIIIGKRLRSVKKDNVADLMNSINEVGVQQPIVVREVKKKGQQSKFKLVAGRHRLEAVRSLGWEAIPARKMTDTGSAKLNDLDDELVEIDENLMRGELTSIERNGHIKERERVRAEAQNEQDLMEAEAQAEQEKKETGKVSEATRSRKRRAVGSAKKSSVKRPVQKAITEETAKVSKLTVSVITVFETQRHSA